jgi:hypothetical protein
LEAQPEHKSNYELDGNDSIKLQIVLAFFQASDLFVNSPLRRRREIEIKVSEEKKKGCDRQHQSAPPGSERDSSLARGN